MRSAFLIVTVHLVKAITRSYAPCVSGEKKSPTRYPLHSRLKRHFVFCIMIICSNIAVEEKAVGRSNTSVYYSERRGIIVTHSFWSYSAIFNASRLQQCMDVIDLFFDDLAEDAASQEIFRYKGNCGMSECMRRV